MSETSTANASDGVSYWKLGAAAVVLIALVAVWYLLPVDMWIDAFRKTVKGWGALGYVAFAAAYAVATVALVPGSLLTIAVGLTYGLWGFPIVLMGATAGASLAFVIARTFLRSKVEAMIADNRTMSAIDKAVDEDGARVVGLLRLSPLVPFNLQNYVFGATSVHFWPYMLATVLGIVPGALLYVWIGSIGGAAASGGSVDVYKWVFLGVGVVTTGIVTWLIGRRASQALNKSGLEKS